MKSKKWFGFVCGFLAAVMLFGVTNMPTLAAGINEFIEVFTGVRVYVNDAPLDPGDLHGNPDAFIYNGTTYVAVRGVSNSLGQDVLWDGDTRSVYIGKHAGSIAYLMDVCPPYKTEGGCFKYLESDGKSFQMGGNKYTNGFVLHNNNGWDLRGKIFFNLNGKYSNMELEIGHYDGHGGNADATVSFVVDGRTIKEVDVSKDGLPQKINVPLNNGLQLVITYDGGYVGFGNITVS